MYISPDEEPMRFENVCVIKDVENETFHFTLLFYMAV